MWTEKTLSKKEVFLIFLVLSLFYVFPVIHADYKYIDDNWRALLLDGDSWRAQGRILLELTVKGLTFTSSTVNIFPLPLLISVFAIASAMTRITLRYFSLPTFTSCLVFLPILCNPFFIGNLTYQYDGPAMVFAVVAAVYAIACNVKGVVLRNFCSVILIAIMFALYQLAVTVFVGLCVVDLVWSIRNKNSVKKAVLSVFQRVVQLLVGGIVYFMSAYQLNDNGRGVIRQIDQGWIDSVWRKFFFAMKQVFLLFNIEVLFVAVIILVAAIAGYLLLMGNIFKMSGSVFGRWVLAGLYMSSVPVLVVCIPGAMLFLMEPNLDARNYIGFSIVLVFLFLLSHESLSRVSQRLTVFLMIPTLFMFSFCYAYGQVLVAKKELQLAMATFIGYDLVSRDELNTKKIFYFLGQKTAGNWIPSAHGAMSNMPVLRYILSSSNTLLFPEFFPGLGITNVVNGGYAGFESEVEALKKQPCKSVVDNKFYTICVVGDSGFIAIKDIVDPEDYTERFRQ